MAFVRRPGTLPKDPVFAPDLDTLGYRLGEDDKFHHKENPQLHFTSRVSTDERVNDVQREAMHDVIRNIVLDRFEELGLKQFFLPTFTYDEPATQTPAVPILITPHEALLRKKRIFVFIGSTNNDLGTLSYRLLERYGGIERGSLLEYVRGIFAIKEWPSPNVDELSRKAGDLMALKVALGIKDPDAEYSRHPSYFGARLWERETKLPHRGNVPVDALDQERVEEKAKSPPALKHDIPVEGSDSSGGHMAHGDQVLTSSQWKHQDIAATGTTLKATENARPLQSLNEATTPREALEICATNELARAVSDETPGIIILNTGQTQYTYKPSKHHKRPHINGRAVNAETWSALPRPFRDYPQAQVEAHNLIPGNENITKHIYYVFEHIINNTSFVSRKAKVHFVGVDEGADSLLHYLRAHCCHPQHDFFNTMASVALINPSPIHKDAPPWDLTSGAMRHDMYEREMLVMYSLFRNRGRIWTRSREPVGTAISSTTYLPLIQDETGKAIEHDPRLQPHQKRYQFEDDIQMMPVVSGGDAVNNDFLLPRCWRDVLAWQLKIDESGKYGLRDDLANEVFPMEKDEDSEEEDATVRGGWDEEVETSSAGNGNDD